MVTGDTKTMDRILGRTGLSVAPISFGAFKIGRNQNTKYDHSYQLPSEEECERLLNAVLDMGINCIDTAPAYGVSENRIGQSIAHRRTQFTLSTKVGEHFADGQSYYAFDSDSIQHSIERSLGRLQTDHLDIVFVHSDGQDTDIIENGETLETLIRLKAEGVLHHVGFSGKTIEGHLRAITSGMVDVLMVEYNPSETSQEDVIHTASTHNVGVIVKKGLGSGTLQASEAIPFCLASPAVCSVVVWSLNAKHLSENLRLAQHCIS